MQCLLDTSAVIATVGSDEARQARARAFARTPRLRLHTTTAAVGEAYTFVQKRAGYGTARQARQSLVNSDVIIVHFLDEELEDSTWAIIDEFAGVPLSYVDATLIALGGRLRVNRIFAFDDDFAQAGLTLVPDRDSVA